MEWQFIGCMIFLAAAFYTDIRTMKIPNRITIAFAATGLAFQGATGGFEGLWSGCKGFAVGFGIMFVLYCFKAVGGGDVKLFGGIGAWTGTAFTLSSLLYSIIAAGVIGLAILLVRGETMSRAAGVLRSVYGAVLLQSVQPLKAARHDMVRFPFMIAVIPGAILAYMYM
ncbi:A24 family peptidase [Paenibacillus caui]|uniref:A24 family peptidase n=1 Tax=Paenibacillus caui TaxID=2873927 RepID=UPI001CA7D8DC|nr:A24 family peptidase [Paenibacillus caui]